MILQEFIEDDNPNYRVKYMDPSDLHTSGYKSVMHDSDDDECCRNRREDEENNMEYGRDAINALKADPVNVPIATYEEGSKFYIDYDDLAAYMEAADIYSIEEALNNVIDCHDDYVIESDNIVVVLPEDAYERFDYDYIDNLEESVINFEM